MRREGRGRKAGSNSKGEPRDRSGSEESRALSGLGTEQKIHLGEYFFSSESHAPQQIGSCP